MQRRMNKVVKALITGANGFLGKNLQLKLAELKDVQVVHFSRSDDVVKLAQLLHGVDIVFHLAGVNRPQDPVEFSTGNVHLTQALCDAVCDVADTTGRKIPIVFTSSTQVGSNNPYAQSKLAAEQSLKAVKLSHGIPVHIFRLPNVFGKWGRPNYNSVVATFCYNTARDLQIEVRDPAATITMVYVDDVMQRFVQLLEAGDADPRSDEFCTVTPQYTVTVGELARQINDFKDSRATLTTERVGVGFMRALYATYMSYLPPESFSYTVAKHVDSRGVFVEMLKTPDCGQVAFFTAHPGVTRGGHYHQSKTEKFLVINGKALFKFRHMQTGETHSLVITGERSEIVETVPGWTHDITNVGNDDMVVMLWANEVYDAGRPDTFSCPL